ncbi:MAG: hypothetical protein JO104_02105 [Candidatus Eremiobacteraeota bacterium]|nr:hypothetical protein [Candidatus Eremiobacteraeota bacterium]
MRDQLQLKARWHQSDSPLEFGPSIIVAEDVPYSALLQRIVLFTLEAAVARSSDDACWEQEEFRRKGLSVVELSRSGKATWENSAIFEAKFAAARNHGVARGSWRKISSIQRFSVVSIVTCGRSGAKQVTTRLALFIV